MISSARREAIEETAYFVEQLGASDLHVDALVVNRVLGRYEPVPAFGAEVGGPLGDMVANLLELDAVASGEDACLEELAQLAPWTPLVRVPLLDDDVHDLSGLDQLAGHLLNP